MQSSVVEPKDIQSTKSSCQTRVTWIRNTENQWISATGISLMLYRESQSAAVPSTQFWDSENALEAQAMLAEADPSKEINVTEYFWRVGQPWRIPETPPECPQNAKCAVSRYSIHFLHRPARDWVIDRLITRAEGVVRSEPDPQAPLSRDLYLIADGPYAPVFEGRFRKGGATFWFSARQADNNQERSTSQMRLTTLQEINDLLKLCANTDDRPI